MEFVLFFHDRRNIHFRFPSANPPERSTKTNGSPSVRYYGTTSQKSSLTQPSLLHPNGGGPPRGTGPARPDPKAPPLQLGTVAGRNNRKKTIFLHHRSFSLQKRRLVYWRVAPNLPLSGWVAPTLCLNPPRRLTRCQERALGNVSMLCTPCCFC